MYKLEEILAQLENKYNDRVFDELCHVCDSAESLLNRIITQEGYVTYKKYYDRYYNTLHASCSYIYDYNLERNK